MDVAEEKVKDNNDKIDESCRKKRRRSSFFDKSRRVEDSAILGNEEPQTNFTTIVPTSSITSGCSSSSRIDSRDADANERVDTFEWKKNYIYKLKKESKDWEDLVWNMKAKYKDAVNKSKKQHLVDISDAKLTERQINFLNDTGIYKKLNHQFTHLQETVALSMEMYKQNRKHAEKVLKLKQKQSNKEKYKVYKESLGEKYNDFSISENEISYDTDDSIVVLPRYLSDDTNYVLEEEEEKTNIAFDISMATDNKGRTMTVSDR